MPDASLPAAVFERGELPKICALTGRDAHDIYRVRLATVPPWAWYLFAAGVVPGAVAVAWFRSRPTLAGGLPFHREAVRRSHQSGRVTRLAVLVTIVFVVLFAAIPRGVTGLLLALSLGATALATWQSEKWNVGGYRHEDAVVVTNAHPRFVAAAEALGIIADIERDPTGAGKGDAQIT